MPCWAINSTNLSNYIKLNKMEETSKTNETPALNKGDVSGSALPEGWLDWNTLPLHQMAEYLRKKYMFSSSGDAKCIYHLIEFYDKHK